MQLNRKKIGHVTNLAGILYITSASVVSLTEVRCITSNRDIYRQVGCSQVSNLPTTHFINVLFFKVLFFFTRLEYWLFNIDSTFKNAYIEFIYCLSTPCNSAVIIR